MARAGADPHEMSTAEMAAEILRLRSRNTRLEEAAKQVRRQMAALLSVLDGAAGSRRGYIDADEAAQRFAAHAQDRKAQTRRRHP